jgi:hypothetical protein
MELDGDIALLRAAIQDRLQITFVCDGRPREACPHILGAKGDGRWAVLVWQFSGGSKRGGIPEWRCFELRDMGELRTRPGEWHRGHIIGRKTQSCVRQIDTQVDAAHGPIPDRAPGSRRRDWLRDQ